MKKNSNIAIITEGAIMIALSTVLSFIKVYRFPFGGSVTLFSMLPVMMFCIKYGFKESVIVTFVFSLIQLIQGIAGGLCSWGLTPIMLVGSILFDYVLAYWILCITGIGKADNYFKYMLKICYGGLARTFIHIISGILIWPSVGEIWSFSTDNVVIYSIVYNCSYMLPEIIFTIIGASLMYSVKPVRKYLYVAE